MAQHSKDTCLCDWSMGGERGKWLWYVWGLRGSKSIIIRFISLWILFQVVYGKPSEDHNMIWFTCLDFKEIHLAAVWRMDCKGSRAQWEKLRGYCSCLGTRWWWQEWEVWQRWRSRHIQDTFWREGGFNRACWQNGGHGWWIKEEKWRMMAKSGKFFSLTIFIRSQWMQRLGKNYRCRCTVTVIRCKKNFGSEWGDLRKNTW